jgi:hypothetical protein
MSAERYRQPAPNCAAERSDAPQFGVGSGLLVGLFIRMFIKKSSDPLFGKLSPDLPDLATGGRAEPLVSCLLVTQ